MRVYYSLLLYYKMCIILKNLHTRHVFFFFFFFFSCMYVHTCHFSTICPLLSIQITPNFIFGIFFECQKKRLIEN